MKKKKLDVPPPPTRLSQDFYMVNTLIFLVFIFMFGVSEYITHFVNGMFGFLLYADWLMIFLMLHAPM